MSPLQRGKHSKGSSKVQDEIHRNKLHGDCISLKDGVILGFLYFISHCAKHVVLGYMKTKSTITVITVFCVDLQIESYYVKAIAAAVGVLLKDCNRLHLPIALLTFPCHAKGNMHKVNRHKALTQATNTDTQAAGHTNIKSLCCFHSLISYLHQHAHQITLFTFLSSRIVCLSRCVETITAEQKLSESVVEINSATLTLSAISVENHFANCAWQCVICFLQSKGQACTPHLRAGVGAAVWKVASPEHLQPLHPHENVENTKCSTKAALTWQACV